MLLEEAILLNDAIALYNFYRICDIMVYSSLYSYSTDRVAPDE
jgi:hypothetical protein